MEEKKIIAAIDLGSHNCRLSIAEVKEGDASIIYSNSKITKLGENLSYRGEFCDESMKLNLDYIKFIKQKLNQFKVNDYRFVATEAFRKSINSKVLVDLVKKETNLNIEIISKEEEARLCLVSCKEHNISKENYGLVFDIGGGSTEIIIVKNKIFNKIETDDFISIPYGVINIDQEFNIFSIQKVMNKIDRMLGLFKNNLDIKYFKMDAIGCCTTITSICAIERNIQTYVRHKVNGVILEEKSIRKIINYYCSLTPEMKKKHPVIKNQNVKLLNNGIIILKKIMQYFPFENILVSDNGLRSGIIREFIENPNEKNQN